jgi:hypothetical protein
VSEIYPWLKWAHVVSSTVLFGMGAEIAFFFVRAQRTGDVRVIAAAAREVVIADAIFTAPRGMPAAPLPLFVIHHRICNGPDVRDEQLGHRAQCPILQRHDCDWSWL